MQGVLQVRACWWGMGHTEALKSAACCVLLKIRLKIEPKSVVLLKPGIPDEPITGGCVRKCRASEKAVPELVGNT